MWSISNSASSAEEPSPPLRYSPNALGRGATMVLQLHDELIFDVCSEDVVQVAKIVKAGMEGCLHLRVPTPVKVKIGATWGDLHPMNL